MQANFGTINDKNMQVDAEKISASFISNLVIIYIQKYYLGKKKKKKYIYIYIYIYIYTLGPACPTDEIKD